MVSKPDDLSVTQRHELAWSVSYAKPSDPKKKARLLDRAFSLGAPLALGRGYAQQGETTQARFALVADAALTAVLVIAWKLASATSTACLDALCTLS